MYHTPNNDKQSKKEDSMLVITGNGTIDWIYYLDLDYIVQPNEIPDTYNRCVRKKVNRLLKVTSDINYIVTYVNNHIKRAYHVHVLKEEATNTSSLSSIRESTITFQTSESATVQVANSPLTVLEEGDSPSIVCSTVSENSEAVSLMESM